MDKGQLVPDEVTIKILQEEIEKNPNAGGFILMVSLVPCSSRSLGYFLASKQMSISATLALDADDEELIKRLVERGKVSGRSDAKTKVKSATVLSNTTKKTAPLIDFYKNKANTILSMVLALLKKSPSASPM